MKISYKWIQQHIEETLPSPETIAEKIIFHAFEIESIERVGDDSIFDIKILPDRAGDCLSHVGIAREIAGLFSFTLKQKNLSALPIAELKLPIEIQSEACRRYIATQIDGVKVGDSPSWLKEKLESIGQRSINNIVDATNYVLFDSGQPIHAFDAKKIDGGIVVRLAHNDEKITTLSNEEKILSEKDLVIADYLGILAIAGVKGGKSAEVSEHTTNIIIEVANFDPVQVRKTSRKLGLVTDASKRFENNFSPELARDAAMQVATLITEIAGGVITGIYDEYKNPEQSQTISFSHSDIVRILGSTITEKNIEDVFSRYRYSFERKDSQFTLVLPVWRKDITGAHDVAEEIGRVIGYNTIPTVTEFPFSPALEQNMIDKNISNTRAWCIEHGYREVYTYTFRPKGEVYVSHGTKNKSALRTNLSDGLRESYELNRLNAPLIGMDKIKIFEIGTVFFADREEIRVAIIDGGTVQELTLADFLKEKNVNDSTLPKHISIPISPFKLWSAYPFIARDIAVWVNSPVDKSHLETILNDFAKQYCIQSPKLFDEFSKEGRISVAFTLIFQAQNRTLTDEDVHGWWDELLERISQEKSFEIR